MKEASKASLLTRIPRLPGSLDVSPCFGLVAPLFPREPVATLDLTAIPASYLSEGILALEPGPGMGFYTLELARSLGSKGRGNAVDVQPNMRCA